MLVLHCALSEKFKVLGPGSPLFAVAGSAVVLPCSVRRPAGQSSLSAVDMNIQWTRPDLREALVHLYENHRDVNTRQIPQYSGRTAVFTEELQNGNVSLRLTDVKLHDEGGYKCRVESRFWEVIGERPVISVEKYDSNSEQFSLLYDFKAELKKSGDRDVVQVETIKGRALICGAKSWDMAAANVLCRSLKAEARGAASAQKMTVKDLEVGHRWPYKCVKVSCTGSEYSLAECTIYEPQDVEEDTEIAALTCYKTPQDDDECPEFRCVNEKCILWKHTCDGVDDCGDNSDEMCCSECQSGAFHCKSGVCIPGHAVRDGIRDCLGGDDEVPTAAVRPAETATDTGSHTEHGSGVNVLWNPKDDIQQGRSHTESQLECGIPNFDYVYRTEAEKRPVRAKRVVGGQEALPTQIQWQVAIKEEQNIHCGGVYLGGCWVLTAAHCVRPKPQLFRVKFSLWQKSNPLKTTDSVPVKNIIIHNAYNPRTYQNDIALVQLEELGQSKECLQPNPAVRSVCVPWSTLQFQDRDTCTISGWGRNREGGFINTLKWANVSIIANCEKYYKERYFEGMECAGDLEGNVDSCQGDSGGPLVCTDASGLSYVWGIVSWGEKCGEAGHPGVYTKVAHYFEWIRFHTGWPAVTNESLVTHVEIRVRTVWISLKSKRKETVYAELRSMPGRVYCWLKVEGFFRIPGQPCIRLHPAQRRRTSAPNSPFRAKKKKRPRHLRSVKQVIRLAQSWRFPLMDLGTHR
ncbi:hypothetical protein SRHO_G00140660 [Serrasalmus rhombeus]